jgi:hypothetical protein
MIIATSVRRNSDFPDLLRRCTGRAGSMPPSADSLMSSRGVVRRGVADRDPKALLVEWF